MPHFTFPIEFPFSFQIAADPVAQRIYEEVAPLAYDDEENGYVLLRFIEAWTSSMHEVDSLVRDHEGAQGWSTVMNVETAPDKFLAFIAQFVGVHFRGGETGGDKRDLIRSLVNMQRGSAAASRAFVQQSLTGTKYMIFNERSGGSAYRYSIRTRTSETPDQDKVLRGLKEQKPAGLILDYSTVGDLTYDTIAAAYDSYTESYADRATYLEWATELPGTS